MEYIKIVKKGKSFAEMKTFCSKCSAKDMKLRSFLGGNPRRIFFLIV